MIHVDPGDGVAVIRGCRKETQSRCLTIKKTMSAMLVGFDDEGRRPGACNTVVYVERLGDLLIHQCI
jgi:hypothetical protein